MATEYEVLREFMEWKQRRNPPFEEKQIAMAIRNLAILGWLNVRPSPELQLPDSELLYA